MDGIRQRAHHSVGPEERGSHGQIQPDVPSQSAFGQKVQRDGVSLVVPEPLLYIMASFNIGLRRKSILVRKQNP